MNSGSEAIVIFTFVMNRESLIASVNVWEYIWKEVMLICYVSCQLPILLIRLLQETKTQLSSVTYFIKSTACILDVYKNVLFCFRSPQTEAQKQNYHKIFMYGYSLETWLFSIFGIYCLVFELVVLKDTALNYSHAPDKRFRPEQHSSCPESRMYNKKLLDALPNTVIKEKYDC